jgi:hypothetical protein
VTRKWSSSTYTIQARGWLINNNQRCQPWDFIPKSWDFLKRLGYFWDFILRNETLGFFLGFLKNSQEK